MNTLTPRSFVKAAKALVFVAGKDRETNNALIQLKRLADLNQALNKSKHGKDRLTLIDRIHARLLNRSQYGFEHEALEYWLCRGSDNYEPGFDYGKQKAADRLFFREDFIQAFLDAEAERLSQMNTAAPAKERVYC